MGIQWGQLDNSQITLPENGEGSSFGRVFCTFPRGLGLHLVHPSQHSLSKVRRVVSVRKRKGFPVISGTQAKEREREWCLEKNIPRFWCRSARAEEAGELANKSSPDSSSWTPVNDSTPAQHLRFISAIISLAPEPSPQICPWFSIAFSGTHSYPGLREMRLTFKTTSKRVDQWKSVSVPILHSILKNRRHLSFLSYPARAKIHLEVEEVLSYDHDDEAERRDNEKKMGMLHAILPPAFVFLQRRSGSNLTTVMSADPYVTFNDRNKNVLCAPLIPDLNHLSESPLR
uniref:Uncharacterized protein n=1 Tax=Moniliophthora roreri TaxID=221103 RepID=A0A0W0G8R7_MONRR